jgi:hypothetical protein
MSPLDQAMDMGSFSSPNITQVHILLFHRRECDLICDFVTSKVTCDHGQVIEIAGYLDTKVTPKVTCDPPLCDRLKVTCDLV